MRLLEQINRRGTTVIMVTHSSEIVNAMGKRVIAIRDGRIVRDESEGMYRPEDDDPTNNDQEYEEVFEL
jgi:cell division transport system ATP-binding protein